MTKYNTKEKQVEALAKADSILVGYLMDNTIDTYDELAELDEARVIILDVVEAMKQ